MFRWKSEPMGTGVGRKARRFCSTFYVQTKYDINPDKYFVDALSIVQ
jgi:hypothetical protein